MTLVYLKSSKPDALEQKALDKIGRFSARNVSKWKGEIESCSLMLSQDDDILAAYKAAGIKTEKIAAVKKVATRKPKSVA